MRTPLILVTLAAVAAIIAALFIYLGVYNPAATIQHTPPVYWLLTVAMRQSVEQRADDIRAPALDDPGRIDHGFRLYHAHCEQCHGAPGVAPAAFALGMTPLPANLALTAREWGDAAQLYWVVKYGIKMSGMPAWEFRLTDLELWNVVAFVNRLPSLSPDQYRAMAEAITETTPTPANNGIAESAGGAERGRVALQQYACVTCHVIPDVVGAANPVGPSLAGIAQRKYLAGTLPNSRESMIRWLRAPQLIAPGSAMPNLGVSERDARDMAAFLETLQ
jgi:mono/diheme cytochrome c family protein